MTKSGIAKLAYKLRSWNIAYRKGTPIVSDLEFNREEDLLREQDPKNQYFTQIGIDPLEISTKKVKLPMQMASMHKLKLLKEIQNWVKRNELENELFVLTPKFDGFSILDDEIFKKKYSRGDGEFGNDITKMFNHTKEKSSSKFPSRFFGEGIILRRIFEEKYSKEILGIDGYENPRNMVASLFNPETKSPDIDKLKDVHFIRYGCDSQISKQDQLIKCNVLNRIQVPYRTCGVDFLTEENLNSLFNIWNLDFELDGIIIDINSYETRERLGRETNGNPKFARAFKGNFETVKNTWIKKIIDQTSKDGFITPVAEIEPIRLDGATVTNVTLYNYRFLKDNKLGILAKIRVKRSGGVIPKIVGVLEPALEVKIPKTIDGVFTEWDENEVELRLVKKTDKWKIQEILHFFRTFDIEEFGEPSVQAFYNAGFDTIERILKIKEQDISRISGFGRKKADFFLKEFQDKIRSGSEIEKIMCSSNIFKGLGEKTLKIINEHIKEAKDLTLNEEFLTEIDGIGKEKSKMYLNSISDFWDWYETYGKLIPIKEEEKVLKESEKFKGQKICFTGFRDIAIEKKIVSNGGEVVPGVSKQTTLLVVKDLMSNSSKVSKARDFGIKIVQREEFKI